MSTPRKLVFAAAVVFVGLIGGMAGTAFAAATFSDVPESHQFYDDVEFMAETGIAGGYPDGTYRPGSPVSRQAMAAFIHRANTFTVESEAVFHDNATTGGASADCPAGTQIVSGGAFVNAGEVYLRYSGPDAGATSWSAFYETEDDVVKDFTVTVRAICGPVEVNAG